jgi:uncharacterized membrane protein YphA (DoxX/SURF4 family)
MNLIRGIARKLIASWFIAEGLDVARHPDPHVALVGPAVERLSEVTALPNSPAGIVRGSGGVLAASGALIALGAAPRLGGMVAAAILGPATACAYPFWREKDREARRTMLGAFLTRAALTGAAVLIAADTSRRDARRLDAARRATSSPA